MSQVSQLKPQPPNSALDSEPVTKVPLLPIELDALSRAEGVGMKEIKAAIPEDCYVFSPWRSVWSVFRAFGALALIAFLLFQMPLSWDLNLLWKLPATTFLWVCQGAAMVGLIILAHDCGHGAFAKRRWVNDWVGYLCTSFTMVGYRNWQISHNHHHAYSQIRNLDTDWPEKMATAEEYQQMNFFQKIYIRVGYASSLGLLVGFMAGNFRRTFLPLGYRQIYLNQRFKRQLLFSTLLMFACTGGLLLALFSWGGLWAVFKYYAMGGFFGFILGSLITQVQHTNADTMVFEKANWTAFRGHIICTFNVRFPRLIEFLAFDFNYHVVHHVAPRIPWYHLRKATAAVKARYPDYIQERPLSRQDLVRFWQNPVLEWNPEMELYTMQALPK